MYEKYANLNDNSRNYFLALLNNKIKDKSTIDRCKR